MKGGSGQGLHPGALWSDRWTVVYKEGVKEC